MKKVTALACYIVDNHEPIFTARRYASAVSAVVVCLSVCLSVSVCVSVCHTPVLYQTAKHRITQIMPHDSPGTLVF